MMKASRTPKPILINKVSILTRTNRTQGIQSVQGQLAAIRNPDLVWASFEVLLGRAERTGGLEI